MTSLVSLRAALNKATRTGWFAQPINPPPSSEIRAPSGDAPLPVAKVWAPEDAALIVAAVNALPALLDVAEKAQAVLDYDSRPTAASLGALREALAALEEQT